MAQSLDALVNALVPQARNDDSLRRELVEHCQDILGRLASANLSCSKHSWQQ
jgi:hypothetical protein